MAVWMRPGDSASSRGARVLVAVALLAGSLAISLGSTVLMVPPAAADTDVPLSGPPDSNGRWAYCNMNIEPDHTYSGYTEPDDIEMWVSCQYGPSDASSVAIEFRIYGDRSCGLSNLPQISGAATDGPGKLRGKITITSHPSACSTATINNADIRVVTVNGVAHWLAGSLSIGWNLTGYPEYPYEYWPGGSQGYWQYNRANLLGYRDSAGYAGDPVDSATGNFIESHTDLGFPVDGLDWTRTYNSQRTTTGAFGAGWSNAAMPAVAEASNGNVIVTTAEGREATFVKSGSTYIRPEEFFATLVKNVDGTFSLNYDAGRQEDFNAAGELAKRTNWDGQEVTFTYTTGVLTSATHSAGYSLTFTYTSGLLISVDASDGRGAAYGYTDTNLTSVTDAAGGVTIYAYDAADRLTTITDPDGTLVIDNVYDSWGRVTSQTTPSGDTITFAYNDSTGVTTETHADRGTATTYSHDRMGRVTSITDFAGEVLTKTYDASGNLTSVIDRRGAGVTQTFDTHGNVLTRSGPEGVEESFTYDSSDRLLTTTNGEDETTAYSYEGTERLPTTVTDGNGKVTSYDVGADGLVDSVTDADGVTLTFGYDATLNPTTVTDEASKVTTLGYDAAGNRTSIETPLGRETTSTWDGMRRLLTVTSESGDTVTETWTPAGRLESRTDAEGHTTSFDYGTAGRLEIVTDPLGNETTYAYDADSNLTSITRPGGAVWNATYDQLGRRTTATDATGVTTTFGYDENGNLTATTDENGGEVTRTYDLRGRVTMVTDQLGHDTVYAYGLADRLTSVTDALSNVTSYTYDNTGRLLTTTQPGSRVWTRAYTDAGRLLTESDPNSETTTYAYDDLGRLETLTDPETHVTTYAYDDDGRLASLTSAEGLVTAYGYDHVHRTATVTSPAGGVTTRTFTPRGQLAEVDEPATDPVSFAYDELGRLETATDALGHDTTYAYDGRGNLVRRTNAKNKVDTWSYDLADRLLSHTDPLGRTTAQTYDALGGLSTIADPSGRTTTLVYDAAHRPTGRNSTQSGAPTIAVTYGYDDLGQRTSMVDPIGTTTWAYNAVGEMTSTTAGGKTLGFGYDLAGNRTGLTYPDATVASFTYDGANRLSGLSHPAAGSVAYTYDDDGRVLTEDLPGTDIRTYSYDTGGRLATYVETLAGQTRTTTLGHDLADHITTEARTTLAPLGPTTTTATYGYDLAGQLTSVTRGSGPTAYAYDVLGNRTTKTVGSRVTTSVYDDASQPTSITRTTSGVPTDAVAFTHDAAGRMTGGTSVGRSRSFAYDATGALISVSAVDGVVSTTTTRTTDGDGRLVGLAATSPMGTTTTSLIWDPILVVPQVATISTGGVDTNYLFGIGFELAIRSGQGDAFAEDVFGSTEARGEAADLARAGSYDEFGSPASTGTPTLLDEALGSANQQLRLGYRGESTVDGLLHLRAREYAPGLGRLTTVDPLDGTPGEVTVAAPYAYAANDPLNNIDPLGLSWINPCIGSTCASDVGGELVEAVSDIPTPKQWVNHWENVGAAKVDAYIEWTGEVPEGVDLFNVAANPYYQRYADYYAQTGESPDSLLDWFNVGANPGYGALDSCSKIGQGRWLDCSLSAVELGAVAYGGAKGFSTIRARGAGSLVAPNTAASIADDVPAFARSQYGRVPAAERAAALERSATCPYCGTNPSSQVDHISALRRDWGAGGWADDFATRTARVNDPGNLIGACASCNAAKGARAIGEGAGQWWPSGWGSGSWWPFGGRM